MTSRGNYDRLPLLEILEDASSGNPKVQTVEYLPHGDFPVIDQGQSFIAGYVNEKEWLCRTQNPVIVFGDHTKTLKFVDFPFVIGADGVKVLKTKSHADAKFVFHYLRTIQLPDVGYSRHFKFLKDLEIPLPSLEDQRRIASILDAADALRSKRRESLRKLEALLKSVFLEMFGDPVTNPKGWEVIELAKTFASKPLLGTMTPAIESGDLKVVRVGELGQIDIDLKSSKCVPVNQKDLARYTLEEGDFLLARAIGSEDHLGKSSVFRNQQEAVIFDSHVMRLKFDKKRLEPIFFYFWLQSLGGRNLFMQKAGRTAVQFNINGTQISEIAIPVPDIQFQNSFVFIADTILKKMQINRDALTSLENLFSALQHQAFNGTLTSEALEQNVRELEKQAMLF